MEIFCLVFRKNENNLSVDKIEIKKLFFYDFDIYKSIFEKNYYSEIFFKYVFEKRIFLVLVKYYKKKTKRGIKSTRRTSTRKRGIATTLFHKKGEKHRHILPTTY